MSEAEDQGRGAEDPARGAEDPARGAEDPAREAEDPARGAEGPVVVDGPSLFETDAVAYSPRWRIAAATLTVVARGSLLAIIAALFLSVAPPSNPLKMMRLFAGLFLAPEAGAWCIARAFAARIRVDEGVLRIEARDGVIEVPLSSLASAKPWRLPVPASGLWLDLHSGRRLPKAVQVKDPVALVDAMVAGGAAADLREGLESPLIVHARARLAHPPGRLENPLVKFVVYGLVPAVPVFRLHQYITYGGTFGEYYTFGLVPYVVAFFIWWGTWAINLLLLAAALRTIVEILAFAVAVVAPSWAVSIRGGLEIAQRIAYYLGVPVWLALRLLA